MKNYFSEKISAFTLIELFLVIVLITLLIFIVSPRFRSTFISLGLRNFSKKTSALLNYAQSRAIAEGVEVYFLKEGNYLILTKNPPQHSSGKREILDNRFFLFIPQSINVVFSGAKEFVFRPDGSIEFIDRENPHDLPKIIISNETTRFQIIPQGIIGKITMEELYE
ncbi:MAG: Tfp pilus assembly protein FimT/FimU [Candidatus Omnitrophota bacterium]